MVGRISSLASQAAKRNPTTKNDRRIDVRRASETAPPHSPMCYFEGVHHTRGLVILFVQKYKENREMPNLFRVFCFEIKGVIGVCLILI